MKQFAEKMPKHFLFLGLGLVVLVRVPVATGGGSARPGANPFSDSRGTSLDEWSKSGETLPLNLVASANVAAKLGPCGCSVNPKGGVDRRLNFIESKKSLAGTLMVLDAGNAFFASRNLDASLSKVQRDRAKKVALAHRELGVLAQNVGLLDLAAGAEFLAKLQRETGLRLISTNLVQDSGGASPFELAHVQDVPNFGKVLVVGVTSLPTEGVSGLKSLNPVSAIRAQVEKHNPHLTVVLSDLGQSEDLNLMSGVKAPMVVIGSRDLNAMDIPLHAANGVGAQPGIQGQQMALVRVLAKGNFSAWRNLTQDAALSQRWNQLVGEYQMVQNEPSSDDKKLSMERIKESFQELNKYAKGPVAKSWPYSYELIDMDERYIQKNSLTKLALEDQ